ncbi:MAG: hypothetical protein C0461_05845 [Brevundimonas sp.]|nr:hypothetical protein [Brevundimonas sp.]
MNDEIDHAHAFARHYEQQLTITCDIQAVLYGPVAYCPEINVYFDLADDGPVRSSEYFNAICSGIPITICSEMEDEQVVPVRAELHILVALKALRSA